MTTKELVEAYIKERLDMCDKREKELAQQMQQWEERKNSELLAEIEKRGWRVIINPIIK